MQKVLTVTLITRSRAMKDVVVVVYHGGYETGRFVLVQGVCVFKRVPLQITRRPSQFTD